MLRSRLSFLHLSLVWALFAATVSAILTPASASGPSPVFSMTTEAAHFQSCDEDGLCTDGPDTAPPGWDSSVPSQPVFGASADDGKAVCDGDGVSGPRVQVLYVYGEGRPDRFEEFRASFRIWASKADTIYQNSAVLTGGTRWIRFVHDANCVISVRKVQVSAEAILWENVYTLKAEIEQTPYYRPDRKLMIFQDDMTGNGLCGIGFKFQDDSPSQDNANNIYSTFAAIYDGCWDEPTTPAHELGHVLGALQSSAPHYTSEFGHCTDEYDIMCYGNQPIVCPDVSRDLILDCNNDDYFHTNPPTGNYLKTHWNLANSRFLGKPEPKMTFDKTSSKYNGVIKVGLSGFAPGYFINLKWPDGTVLAQVKADASGNATTSFRTPLSPLGNYQVRASNSQGEFALATLRVIPRILLNETAGEAGSSIRVYFYGFAPGDRVEVRFWNEAGTSSVKLTTITIASNGRGSKVVTIPVRTTIGDHKIVGKVIGVSRSASTYFEVTGLGESEEPTATATATATETPESTETAEPTPEFTITPEPTVEVPTEEPTADVPTEEPTAEVPTEEPTAGIPTEEPTAEAPTEEPVPTGTPVPESTGTPGPEPTSPGEEPVAVLGTAL